MQTSGELGVLVTVVRADGSTPRKVGSRMLVFEDGSLLGTIGGGQVEQAVRQEAAVVLESGSPKVRSFNLTQELAMCCGGQMSFLLEPVAPPIRWIVFGCGHVGRAILRQSQALEVQVIAVDDLEENLQGLQELGVHQIVDSFDLDQIGTLSLGPRTMVVITTREHALDQRLLETVLPHNNKYVGVIGSKRKAHVQRQRLLAKGFSEDLVDTVVCPIGMDIGAETPAEIAVAVVAQLIEVMRVPAVSNARKVGAQSVS